MHDFSHLHVEFYKDTIENVRRTAEEGRPIFDEVEMIKMRIAGDPKSVLCAPVHSASAHRDPSTNHRLTYAQLHGAAYDAWKRGQAYHGSGTPLSEAPFISMSKRKELEALNVFTVEQLADLDGGNLARIGMGGRDLKNKAVAMLDSSKGIAAVSKIAAENEELKARLAKLESLMAGNQAPLTLPSEPESEIDSASPFADWDVETLRLWYTDNGGHDAQPNWKRSTFIKKCTDLNEQIRKQKEAA